MPASSHGATSGRLRRPSARSGPALARWRSPLVDLDHQTSSTDQGPPPRPPDPGLGSGKSHDTAIKRHLIAACTRTTGWGKGQLPVGPQAEDLVGEVWAGDLA